MKIKLAFLLALSLLASSLFADTTADQVIGRPATFSVTNDGTPPFTYQWKKDGVNLAGKTTASFTISAVALTDVGTYTVQVTNKAGTTLSDKGVFTIAVDPKTATVVITTP